MSDETLLKEEVQEVNAEEETVVNEEKENEEVASAEVETSPEVEQEEVVQQAEVQEPVQEVVDKKKAKKKEKPEPAGEEAEPFGKKKEKQKAKMSKSARKRRLLILIVTAYIDIIFAWLLVVKEYFFVFLAGLLNGAYLSLQSNYEFTKSIFIVVITLVVNLIAIGLLKDARKIKGEQNSNLLDILNDTENIDGRVTLEEEFSVEGGENKPAYRASRTIEAIDMKRVYSDFMKFALENGIQIDKVSARELFAALAGSRLILVNNDDKELRDKFFDVLARFFDVSTFVQEVSEETNSLASIAWIHTGNVASLTPLAKGVVSANKLIDKINFVFFENVHPSTMNQYFKEIFEHCKNPEVPCQIKVGPKNVNNGYTALPKNLWFLMGVEGENEIPSEVAKYSYNLNLNIKAVEPGEHVKFKPITYPQLMDAINEAYEEHFISEDMWKKLDEFENYLAKRGEYFIDNRIVREMERFAAIYLVCEGEQTDLIDTLLSHKLLLVALPNTYSYLENDEETIMGMAEKIIGADFITNSQAILKQIKTN